MAAAAGFLQPMVDWVSAGPSGGWKTRTLAAFRSAGTTPVVRWAPSTWVASPRPPAQPLAMLAAASLSPEPRRALSAVINPSYGNDRVEGIRYDSPTIGGFVVQAFWGEDDIWTASIRYAGEARRLPRSCWYRL